MIFNPQLKGALRVLPHDGMEGFFLCRIIKQPQFDINVPLDLKAIGKFYADNAE